MGQLLNNNQDLPDNFVLTTGVGFGYYPLTMSGNRVLTWQARPTALLDAANVFTEIQKVSMSAFNFQVGLNPPLLGISGVDISNEVVSSQTVPRVRINVTTAASSSQDFSSKIDFIVGTSANPHFNIGTKYGTNELVIRGFAGTTVTGEVSFPRGGSGIRCRAASSTGVMRQQFEIAPSWIVSTDATRTSRATFSVFDFNGTREFMRADATGSAAFTSFTGNVGVGTGSMTPGGRLHVLGGNILHNEIANNGGVLLSSAVATNTISITYQEVGTGVASLLWDNVAGNVFKMRGIKAGSILAFDSANTNRLNINAVGAIQTTTNGWFATKRITAPADADIATSEVAYWFDQTAGAAKLKIKGKNASGTVVTGEVVLA